MKRACLLAIGSRGDVDPCIALALGLRRAGWAVRIAALDPFAEVIHRHGIEFASLGALPARFTAGGRRAPHRGLAGRALFWAVYQRLLAGYLPRFAPACAGASLIVHTGLAFPAYHVAEAMGVPCAALALVPGLPTDAFVHPLFARRRLAVHPRYNRATHAIEWQMMLQSTAGVIDRWRRDTLDLPSVPRRHAMAHRWDRTHAWLVAVSPTLAPRPANWPATAHVVGSLALDDGAPPDADLRAWVEDGPPPIYAGFGSMTRLDERAAARALVGALAALGRRGVFASGWGGLPSDLAAPHVRVVEAISHRWLFPRCAAAVHHGGVGTTTAALRAGVPSVVAPVDYDQRFWALRLAELSAAPPPLDPATLDTPRLTMALRHALDPDVRARMAPLQEAVAGEDGVAASVAVLERCVDRSTRDRQMG